MGASWEQIACDIPEIQNITGTFLVNNVEKKAFMKINWKTLEGNLRLLRKVMFVFKE